jgi:hypothetical protein
LRKQEGGEKEGGGTRLGEMGRWPAGRFGGIRRRRQGLMVHLGFLCRSQKRSFLKREASSRQHFVRFVSEILCSVYFFLNRKAMEGLGNGPPSPKMAPKEQRANDASNGGKKMAYTRGRRIPGLKYPKGRIAPCCGVKKKGYFRLEYRYL